MCRPEQDDREDDRRLLIDELKEKRGELRGLLPEYIKAFTVSVAITGALLKFALDKSATPELRIALSIVGCALSCLGFAVCLFAEGVRRAIIADISSICQQTGVPTFSSEALPLKYAVITAFVVVVLTFAGWVYIMLS